jgi:hypothetical protein
MMILYRFTQGVRELGAEENILVWDKNKEIDKVM